VSAPPLATIAHWAIPDLRGSVSALDGVAARLAAWRARAEEVRRSLELAACWTGPTAEQAARSVRELSAVGAQVALAFGESLVALQGLLNAADEAQRNAGEALALAASVGADLEADGGLRHAPALPTPAMAPDQAAVVGAEATAAARASALAVAAISAAQLADAAGESADAALRPLGVVAALAPATLTDVEVAFLGRHLGLPSPAPDPHRVARWWAALPEGEQQAAIRADPELMGALDGLPAWVRDQANRILLAAALADPAGPGHRAARSIADAVERADADGGAVQLWSLDLRGGRVAVAVGDLDTADAVGVLVPGVGTDVADLGARLGDARNVAAAARESAVVGSTVATVAWLNYLAPPNLLGGATRLFAHAAGPRLDAALDGLAASRGAGSRPDVRTTVVAHSYGTGVVEEAAGQEGRLAADAVVLLGSPGMAGSAEDLETPEVYQALAPSDLVRLLAGLGGATELLEPVTGPLGSLTDAEDYGATHLPTDGEQGHSDYYAPGHPTLAAIGGVVAGTSWR
jgi:hypothetical protein